mgnify:CR=1 FL=1
MIDIPRQYRKMIYTNSEEGFSDKGGAETFLLTRTAMISEDGENTILVQVRRKGEQVDKLRKLAISEDGHTEEGFITMILPKEDLEKAIEITGVVKSRRKTNTVKFDNLKEFYGCDIIMSLCRQIGFKGEPIIK